MLFNCSFYQYFNVAWIINFMQSHNTAFLVLILIYLESEMSKIEWSEKLNVGVDEIDTQHKELIKIANALIHAITIGKNEMTINNVVRKLREYTVFHFNSEEKLMKKNNYDKYIEHKAEHEQLKKSVKKFQRSIYEKKQLSGKDLFEFMKTWLLDHILKSDMRISAFLNKKNT